jgi:hypothetical protein
VIDADAALCAFTVITGRQQIRTTESNTSKRLILFLLVFFLLRGKSLLLPKKIFQNMALNFP